KVFTQTVRALRDDVKAVPPIELAYFDTATGAYEVARSEAVPLVVNATRVLTAGDAEGLGPAVAAQAEIQSWVQGIAHNYRGTETLSKQVLGFAGLVTPGRLVLVALPPLAYAVLFAVVATNRRRHANPDTVRARRALGTFNRDVAQTGTAEEVLGVLCCFLGDKLAMTSDALTYRDVEGPLRDRGVGEEALAQIKELFVAGEASRFAGGSGERDLGEVRDRAKALVAELEKALR
ncbi:MAG: protein BatD, partial [Akkermansiaceae bacterium]|nr:protein BatD [Akkermansiaceae bacterium]